MALIKCSECGKEISSKATNCIHCGCPINDTVIESVPTKKNSKSLILSFILLGLATCFIIESEGDMYWLPLLLYVAGFITLILSIFSSNKGNQNNFERNNDVIKNEKDDKKYLSLIRDDEEVIMTGIFNKELQKKIITMSCFPLFAMSILFTFMGLIWSLDDEEPVCLVISVVAILGYILVKKLKNWLNSYVDDEYLVLTDKRLLLKLKWQKLSLVYSKISTVYTENFIFRGIRLVVNLGSSIYISHLINDEEIAEEILKRIN